MKICFVMEDFYPSFIGGQGIYGKNLVEELSKKNKVYVLAEKRKNREKYWQNKKNVQLFLTPFCFGNQIVLSALEYLLLKVKLGRIQFDILHANQLSALFFIFFRPKNIRKIIVSVHNTNFDMFKVEESIIKRLFYRPLIWLERFVYKNADGLLFNSLQEEQALKKYYSIKNKSTESVYLGVEKIHFTEEERLNAKRKIRTKFNLDPDAKIVLYVGRIVKRKMVGKLIEAMRIISGAGLKFYLDLTHPAELGSNTKSRKILTRHLNAIIIGEGLERKNLEKNASPNVKFLGYVENTKPYFLAADLFVLTSVAEGGIALSVLEAASYGLPLILSPSAAGCPIIKNGKNGYIVNPYNEKELAEKITSVLKHSEKMRYESLKFAKYFTWADCANGTYSFYQQLLGKA